MEDHTYDKDSAGKIIDYYKILSVSSTATTAAIQSAFRKLSLKCHPDRNPNNPTAEEQFKILNNAKSTLEDPKLRKEYDEFVKWHKEAPRLKHQRPASPSSRTRPSRPESAFSKADSTRSGSSYRPPYHRQSNSEYSRSGYSDAGSEKPYTSFTKEKSTYRDNRYSERYGDHRADNRYEYEAESCNADYRSTRSDYHRDSREYRSRGSYSEASWVSSSHTSRGSTRTSGSLTSAAFGVYEPPAPTRSQKSGWGMHGEDNQTRLLFNDMLVRCDGVCEKAETAYRSLVELEGLAESAWKTAQRDRNDSQSMSDASMFRVVVDLIIETIRAAAENYRCCLEDIGRAVDARYDPVVILQAVHRDVRKLQDVWDKTTNSLNYIDWKIEDRGGWPVPRIVSSLTKVLDIWPRSYRLPSDVQGSIDDVFGGHSFAYEMYRGNQECRFY